jgi:hypothetical protein
LDPWRGEKTWEWYGNWYGNLYGNMKSVGCIWRISWDVTLLEDKWWGYNDNTWGYRHHSHGDIHTWSGSDPWDQWTMDPPWITGESTNRWMSLRSWFLLFWSHPHEIYHQFLLLLTMQSHYGLFVFSLVANLKCPTNRYISNTRISNQQKLSACIHIYICI